MAGVRLDVCGAVARSRVGKVEDKVGFRSVYIP